MGVDSTHPLYDEKIHDWELLRDASKGERTVKSKREKYLPMTEGMILDGARQATRSEGAEEYEAYKTRAIFPDWVNDAVESALGLMHSKLATFEVPEAMEPLLKRATLRNESLQMLLQRINEEQLITGRLGLMADVIDSGASRGQLYITTYQAEHITNWDEGSVFSGLDRTDSPDEDEVEPQNLNIVILNESNYERTREMDWEYVQKYRALMLGDTLENEPLGEGTYKVGRFRNERFLVDQGDFVEPQILGRTLDQIPFVFVNTKDITPEPDEPPLMGLGNLAIAGYRGDADYRQHLFKQGQDTLVTIGNLANPDNIRIGSGGHINIVDPGGDAKMIGVDSNGLTEQREALQNLEARAEKKTVQFLANMGGTGVDSGVALRIKVGTRTASLNQIATTGAFALEELLKIMAKWMGLAESVIEEIRVIPNLDFVDDPITGQELGAWMAAKRMGFPISLESLHLIGSKRGATEMSFEDELEKIEEEEAQELSLGSTNPEGPEEDEEEETEEQGEPVEA